MMYRLLGALICVTVASNLFAAEIHLSPSGDDSASGAASAPMSTLKAAAAKLRPGDVCVLHDGAYRDALVIEGLKGAVGKPITFRAARGEQPVLDGTINLDLDWAKGDGGVWSAKIDHDVWQLFDDDELLAVARFPNARLSDPHFWNQKATFRKFDEGSEFGRVVDTRPVSDKGAEDKSKDEGVSLGVDIPDGVNTQSLADTAVSMKGAVAVLNMGSWFTWAQFVGEHEAGSDTFTYSTDFSGAGRSIQMTKAVNKWCNNTKWWNLKNMQAGQGHYFLEGAACLDQPGEWWFDHLTDTLLLIPPEGKTPDQLRLRGKVMSYALDLTDCADLVFDGIDFFAATFHLQDCQRVTIENADLRYPSHSRRTLGELGVVDSTRMECKAGQYTVAENVVRNCRFSVTDGPGMMIERERGDLIENCLFRDIDISAMDDGKTLRLNGDDTTIRRVTVTNTGGSECIAAREGAHIEFCHFWNTGKLQHDGSATQFSSFQRRVEVNHNWSHDHPKNGFRFDGGGGPPAQPSQFGTMHHNVTWNTRGFTVKGDKHLINNNVVCKTFKDMIIMVYAKMNGVNKETVTINNIAVKMDSSWFGKNRPPVPGTVAANLIADPSSVLRDPANWDFRPKPDAKIIDAGVVEEAIQYANFSGIDYEGKAPDIGAYEHGAETYWIPGFQYDHASTPVPPDGATTVKRDADLMFLGAYRTNKHVVYFDAGDGKLARRAELSDTNIFDPGALRPDTKYRWRVDAIAADDTVVEGSVWAFTVE